MTSIDLKNQNGIAHLVILLLVVVGVIAVGLISYNNLSKSNQQNNINNPSPVNKVTTTAPRSKKLGVIKNAATARVIDVKTGRPIQLAKVFTAKDKKIYLSLALNNHTPATKIEYVRYLNGRYIDHKSLNVADASSQYANFDWTLNNRVLTYHPGTYRVKTYTNGVFEKNVVYEVNQQGVAYCLNCGDNKSQN